MLRVFINQVGGCSKIISSPTLAFRSRITFSQYNGSSEGGQKIPYGLIHAVQESIPGVRSKYFSEFEHFEQLGLQDNVEYFKVFRKDERVNDLALFGYFSLLEVQEMYKKDHKILQFLLEPQVIQRFRESFATTKKFQTAIEAYFSLPFSERKQLTSKRFGEKNVLFYIHFYPLYDLFVVFLSRNMKKKYEKSIETCDRLQIGEPHNLFPEARKMKRKIVYHCGPTNSGKTHAAIQQLMNSESGIYCAPLRLLAREIYEKFREKGISCNLLTGQEKLLDSKSPFYSCTTEIASQKTDILFDCAVIDEIQLLGDSERGGAWTMSLLGLQAKEIHLCGDGRALELVKNICKQTGDEFSCVEYTRMSKLRVMEKEYNMFEDLKEGDCFICFSVQESIAIKSKINAHVNKKKGKEEGCDDNENDNHCSIVYGRLPPEIKKMQADLFNTRKNKYMVATNAIGMGLNLNIQRIIFTSFKKNHRSERRGIDRHEIVQIAGRAGRFKEDGIVCARHISQIAVLKETFATHPQHNTSSIEKAAFFPTFEMIESFSLWVNGDRVGGSSRSRSKKTSLSEIFTDFTRYSTFQGNYFIGSEEDFCVKADLTENLGLTLKDQFTFCLAPMRLGKSFQKEREIFKVFASKYASGKPVVLPEILRSNEHLTEIKESVEQQPIESLTIYESLYYILELYIWLANKFGTDSFPEAAIAQNSKQSICTCIQEIHSHQV